MYLCKQTGNILTNGCLNVKKMEESYPYKECSTCQSLDDCPHPDLSDGQLSLPMIPDECPFPIKIMKATLKKHKVNHELLRKN
jgi:hypothetical protein